MWNYRVVRRTHISLDNNRSFIYGIYEVYYSEGGRIEGLSEDSQHVFGESLEELKKDHELMGLAFKFPVVDYETLEEIKD